MVGGWGKDSLTRGKPTPMEWMCLLQWDRSHHKCYIIFYQIAELNIKRMDNELRYPLFSVQNTFQHFWQTASHRDTIEQPAIILATNRQLNLHNYVSLHYLASCFLLARTANSKLQQIFVCEVEWEVSVISGRALSLYYKICQQLFLLLTKAR